jgi:aldose 1-epimerase
MTQLAREAFGRLPDGTTSEMVTLRGDNGFEARIISYGAVLQSLFVPDRAGRLADVVWRCCEIHLRSSINDGETRK